MAEVFDDDQRRAIAGGARTLFERLDEPGAVVPDGRDDDEVGEVLDEWRAKFPTEADFQQRLDRAGVTEAECREAIAAGRLADDEPVPAWVDRLEEVVAAVQSRDPGDVPERLDDSEDLDAGSDQSDDGPTGAEERRFGPLSAAIAEHAVEQLPDDPVQDALPEPAVWAMAEWLRRRFGSSFTRVLYVELKTFVATHDRDRAFTDPDDFEEPPTEYYEQFLAFLFDGGLAQMCVEYPVFARQLVTQLRQFEAHLREFSRRLEADREALADRFGDDDGGGDDGIGSDDDGIGSDDDGHDAPQDGLGPVVDLEPLADDTHGDGRAVMRVAFASGVTVAYKPRSVDAGEAFSGVLDRLNDHLDVPDLATPTYLAGDGYGWMEWFEYAGCEDEAAVERYYRRVGALTCLAYLLEFSDCQYENVVVAGEQPVLVDAETVMHPYFHSDRKPRASGLGALVDDSVLLTMLLPYGVRSTFSESSHDATAATAGVGVSGEAVELDDVPVPQVKAANTDVMTVEEGSARVDRSENVPAVDGTQRPPDGYLAELLDGFETTFETVLELRDDGRLFDEVGLYDALSGVENRVVYRATSRYGRLLWSLGSWVALRDGARFGVHVEDLTVPFVDGRTTHAPPWALYDAERRALRRLDPPRFTARTDERAVRMDGEPVGVDADESGLARSRERLRAASREDVAEQVELLRGSFGALPSPLTPTAEAPSPGRRQVGDDELVAEARRLFDRVEDAALVDRGGTYHWTSVVPQTGPGADEHGSFRLRPTDGSLYAGRCGIALFGGALYRVTGEDRYWEFALAAVDPLREDVREGRTGGDFGFHGGTAGVGAVAYGLSALGDLVDEPAMVEEAVAVADVVDSEFVAGDDSYDVLEGAAGTLLGLLAANDRRADPALVSAAVDCGDHLLDNRVETDGGVRVWETVDHSPPLTGVSHGVAGIAYALARLYDVTGDDRYRDAAVEAVEYESRAYSEAAGNWPDRRQPVDAETYPDQWCHGRSGIGLARLGMTAVVDDDRVERGLERAIATFPAAGNGNYDHLCCGDAGRAEFLLEVERRLGRRAGEARGLLGGVVDRQREAGVFRKLPKVRAVTDPTLFLGLSGIGYSMLRVVESDLPCLLLWE